MQSKKRRNLIEFKVIFFNNLSSTHTHTHKFMSIRERLMEHLTQMALFYRSSFDLDRLKSNAINKREEELRKREREKKTKWKGKKLKKKIVGMILHFVQLIWLNKWLEMVLSIGEPIVMNWPSRLLGAIRSIWSEWLPWLPWLKCI